MAPIGRSGADEDHHRPDQPAVARDPAQRRAPPGGADGDAARDVLQGSFLAQSGAASASAFARRRQTMITSTPSSRATVAPGAATALLRPRLEVAGSGALTSGYSKPRNVTTAVGRERDERDACAGRRRQCHGRRAATATRIASPGATTRASRPASASRAGRRRARAGGRRRRRARRAGRSAPSRRRGPRRRPARRRSRPCAPGGGRPRRPRSALRARAPAIERVEVADQQIGPETVPAQEGVPAVGGDHEGRGAEPSHVEVVVLVVAVEEDRRRSRPPPVAVPPGRSRSGSDCRPPAVGPSASA